MKKDQNKVWVVVKGYNYEGGSVVAVTKYRTIARSVVRKMGHSSVSTTERYVYNIDRDMKDTMNLPMFVDKTEKLKEVKLWKVLNK